MKLNHCKKTSQNPPFSRQNLICEKIYLGLICNPMDGKSLAGRKRDQKSVLTGEKGQFFTLEKMRDKERSVI